MSDEYMLYDLSEEGYFRWLESLATTWEFGTGTLEVFDADIFHACQNLECNMVCEDYN